ncbi:hypothetical protein [Nonomuraea dietziae]|uniref:Quercetin dioxygenase-like cupin family protein n=1 Tax=Nonomuraea dietziae TaxID=65515 RepID=A0A7W5VDE1_9ACTN|nr:hypothetical protein [Nonomuraea dietziae]MBB3734009.1 quercetin dioxygenase-like cupin family protein [Nonomuraea dietziae]
MGDEGEPISFLGRRLPAAFELHVVVVAPGGVHAYDGAEWRDAIVLVEHGVIELVYSAGGGRVCETGDVMWLDGLPVRAMRNTRDEPVVLVAVSRRDADRA